MRIKSLISKINVNGIKKNSIVIFIWQLITFLVALTMICSNQLEKNGVSLPTLQSLFCYFLLMTISGTFHLYYSGLKKRSDLKSFLKIAFISFCDVEGNFFIILAFRYTTLTSISILNCSTAIFVTILSCFFLSLKIRIINIIFMVISISGLVLLIISDALFPVIKSKSISIPWKSQILGDFFVILGCFLYSIENVSEEHLVKNETLMNEYLSIFGFCSFIICGIQGIVLDRHSLVVVIEKNINKITIIFFIIFTISLTILYISIALMIKKSSAAMMNISFLVVDFWTILFDSYINKVSFNWLFYIALIITFMGIFGFQITLREIDN